MKTIWNKFETWFNKNWAWFFTNGNKQQASKTVQRTFTL